MPGSVEVPTKPTVHYSMLTITSSSNSKYNTPTFSDVKLKQGMNN